MEANSFLGVVSGLQCLLLGAEGDVTLTHWSLDSCATVVPYVGGASLGIEEE